MLIRNTRKRAAVTVDGVRVEPGEVRDIADSRALRMFLVPGYLEAVAVDAPKPAEIPTAPEVEVTDDAPPAENTEEPTRKGRRRRGG